MSLPLSSIYAQLIRGDNPNDKIGLTLCAFYVWLTRNGPRLLTNGFMSDTAMRKLVRARPHIAVLLWRDTLIAARSRDNLPTPGIGARLPT